MTDVFPCFRYWGKADRNGSESYHLLVYHALDVAAVGAVWWELSPRIQKTFCESSSLNSNQVRAWVIFFLALHDLGKFDIRFQRKQINLWKKLQRPLSPTRLSPADSKMYYHGPAGLYWFNQEFEEVVMGEKSEVDMGDDDFFGLFEDLDQDQSPNRAAWKPWIEAVTGHHGHIISSENNQNFRLPSDCPELYREMDKRARRDWIHLLESLFLTPQGISIRQLPPLPPSISFIGGFCSVADWIGSANSERHFCYCSDSLDLAVYFEQRRKDACKALKIAGLVGKVNAYAGVQALLKVDHEPHQVQTIVDQLTNLNGLTIIEAPTGSGKTEAALAYAWNLLANGMAESIVFALPTQAMSNAMLNRMEKAATILFKSHPNLLLAHGNARFNADFVKLREQTNARQHDDDEAWAQCSLWLAQSRKRAFLGQIGVCTIDQVLTSVLPVRHRFIRSFGLGRSVLIIDEVHAYDAYMYGLLTAVLKEQRSVGGSAVLLSATLPHYQRQELFNAWDRTIERKKRVTIPPYPLISQLTTQSFKEYCVAPEQMPPEKKVWIEPLISKECNPTVDLVQDIISAAKSGAGIAVICNLVDAAHQLFNEISKDSTVPVMLFHSRFTLSDRQQIERSLLNFFGPDSTSTGGRILIATQVVEQSLDVDFDWMITQLCPVDLLFQRLGRLHRHAQKNAGRPKAFAVPRCTVLLPDGLDYGLHGLIYANTRVLWRTAEKLFQLNGNPIIFPNAYRQWVEAVYQEEPYGSEPPEIEKSYEDFLDTHQSIQKSAAKLMINSAKNISPFMDDDQHITAVTRDGQMSLTIVPFVQTSKGRLLRNHSVWDTLTLVERPEAFAMNMVCVPNTWQAALDKHVQAEDGIYWLPMNADGDTWQTPLGKWELQYNPKKGLERIK